MKFIYHGWRVWNNGKVWQARHTKTKEYMNFSGTDDVERIKTVLDDPALIKEQKELVAGVLRKLEAVLKRSFAAIQVQRAVNRRKRWNN